MFELIKQGGAWFSFDESLVAELKEAGIELKAIHQGFDNMRIYLEENPEITKALFARALRFLNTMAEK
jgi:hypothetical protein